MSRTPLVLCVDDEPNILKSMERLLSTEPYQLVTASSGQQALELMSQMTVDVVISDMRMPHMSGSELVARIATHYPDTVRMVLTGYADLQSAITAVNDGAIHRYLQKPWQNEDLKVTIREALEKLQLQRKNKLMQRQLSLLNKQLQEVNQQLEQKVNQRTAQLRQSLRQLHDEHNAMYKVLYNVVSIAPDFDGGVAQNVSEVCRDLAVRLGLEKQQVDEITLAGLLFEIGLLGIPSALYQKPFHKLSPAERQQFYRHPQQAQLMLLPAPHLHRVSDIILHQYERYNGGGVPHNLVADAIPIGARILTIARDYWGFQLGRVGKEELSPAKALQQIKLQQGTTYDPLIVRELAKVSLHDVMAFNDHTDHKLKIEDLQAGMVLQRALYNTKKILILPEGHVFTSATITRLKALVANNAIQATVYAQQINQHSSVVQQSMLDKALHSLN